MTQFRKRVIMIFTFMVGLMVMGILIFIPNRTEEMVELASFVAGAIMFGGLIWGFVVIRCPHCGGGLPLREWAIVYCPRCGEKIDNDK